MTRLVALLVVAAAACGTAHAGWSGSGTGVAFAAGQSLGSGNMPSASVSGTAVTVSWAASTLSGGSAAPGYLVKRYDATGTPAGIVGGCSGTIAALSCIEQPVAAGTWRYAVIPVAGSWRGAESGQSTNVTVRPPPDQPTSVALANGAGQGSAYVNGANAGSVGVTVGLPSTSVSSNVVRVTVSDGTVSVSGTTWASHGAGDVTVTGLETTGLADGTLTLTASATDTSSSSSAPRTATVTKDTVAPAQPTSIALANGGGVGSAYINAARASSLNVSVGLGSPSVATDTVSVTVTSGSSATGSTAATTGAGTVTVMGINTSALVDGTASLGATATDLAGNTSAGRTATAPKDTVAPARPLSVALANGGGQANAYINAVNRSSVNVSVALPSTSFAADTVTVALTSGASVTASIVASTGAATVTASGINATGLGDGTVALAATSTDSAGNTSSAASSTAPKDTVAPAQLTSVSLTNGAGKDNAYVNAANAAAVSVSAGFAASSVSADVATLTLTSGSSVSASRAASAGGGTVTFSGLNASGLADGTATMSATSTDLAGNTSAVRSATAPKDTAAPAVTLTSPANGAGNVAFKTPYAGRAGTASGDLSAISVKTYLGANTSGALVYTLSATASSGAWAVTATASLLTRTTYTAQAQQSDDAGNVGSSSANTFTIK